jgi:ectoine hydroxylase-related dioxygenase (phytanoyl-CoA dioxygenase family)
MHPTVIAAEVEDLGFSKVESIFTEPEITKLLEQMPQIRTGMRNLLALPFISDLAQNPKLLQFVHSVLGHHAFVFKATFFDKNPEANWLVPWHQDLTIPVDRQFEYPVEHPGWGPWSTKAGVLFVQPPTPILEKNLAVRIHLDSCLPNNGALKVLPKTHQMGRLSPKQITELRQQIPAHTCAVNAGGIVLMRPLLLHASSKSTLVSHRRVIHFEYAVQQLPDPYPKLVSA